MESIPPSPPAAAPPPAPAPATNVGLFGLRAAKDERRSPAARLRKLARLEREDLSVVLVYSMAIGLVSLAVPVASQSLVNTVAFAAQLQPLIVLSALVFLGLAAAGVLKALQQQVVETFQQRLFVRSAHETVLRVVNSDVKAFDARGPAELMNRFFDVMLVQKAASSLLLEGLSVFLQGIVSLLLLAFYHPLLLAFDVVLILLIVFIIWGLGRDGVSTAIRESNAKHNTVAWFQDMARSVRSLKADTAQEFALHRTDDFANEYVQARSSHFRILLRQIVASYAVQALATAALLGVGAGLVIQGELTLGQLVAAELVVTGVLASVARLGKHIESYYDLSAAIYKLGEIVDLPSERKGGALARHSSRAAHVSAHQVRFAYSEQGRDILQAVSFDVESGGRLAVLGSNASGKSTLVDLLYGLRLPSSGHLALDGVDLRTLALNEIRQDIALAGRVEVFDGTVLENLRLGESSVDAELAERSLAAVGLDHEMARMPAGIMTRLGASGNRLSTTQGGRLMIARALARRPRVLLIDQALDSLSLPAAIDVLKNIEAMPQRPTTLVFTSSRDLAEAVGEVITLANADLQGFKGEGA